MVVIVLALEAAPRVVTVAASEGEERRVIDWCLKEPETIACAPSSTPQQDS
jgi:hypothetical protein